MGGTLVWGEVMAQAAELRGGPAERAGNVGVFGKSTVCWQRGDLVLILWVPENWGENPLLAGMQTVRGGVPGIGQASGCSDKLPNWLFLPSSISYHLSP